MSSKTVRRVSLLAVALGLTGGACVGASYYFSRSSVDTPEYEFATVTKGELAQVITASGQLNPVVKVDVGSQISGNIQKLLADFNSLVTQGQIVAQLDPATFEANVIQAEGNLANAKAALELAAINAKRAKSLQVGKLTPEAEYDRAYADLLQAEAAVKLNEGILKRAKVDLARCTIYAPIDGIVISRNVNVGQTVAASMNAPTLFIIANDLSKMQIEANVVEADVGVVEVGQDVDFTVDAFPDQTFHGKVAQIRNAPKIDQNVVTYETIIDVSNAKRKLKPGMTANVSIVVAQRQDALKIPNAALRFRPSAPKKSPSLGTSDSKTRKKSSGSKKEKHKAEKTVYVLASGTNSANALQPRTPQPVQIKPGITDGSFTEVVDGLKEGDNVILSATTPAQVSLGTVSSLFGGRKKKH
jgi:HlyD family secretion protein